MALLLGEIQPRLSGCLRNVKLLVYNLLHATDHKWLSLFRLGLWRKSYLSFRGQVLFCWDASQHPTASLILRSITTAGQRGKGERRGTRGSAALPLQWDGNQDHPSTPKQACKLGKGPVGTAQNEPAPPEGAGRDLAGRGDPLSKQG